MQIATRSAQSQEVLDSHNQNFLNTYAKVEQQMGEIAQASEKVNCLIEEKCANLNQNFLIAYAKVEQRMGEIAQTYKKVNCLEEEKRANLNQNFLIAYANVEQQMGKIAQKTSEKMNGLVEEKRAKLDQNFRRAYAEVEKKMGMTQTSEKINCFVEEKIRDKDPSPPCIPLTRNVSLQSEGANFSRDFDIESDTDSEEEKKNVKEENNCWKWIVGGVLSASFLAGIYYWYNRTPVVLSPAPALQELDLPPTPDFQELDLSPAPALQEIDLSSVPVSQESSFSPPPVLQSIVSLSSCLSSPPETGMIKDWYSIAESLFSNKKLYGHIHNHGISEWLIRHNKVTPDEFEYLKYLQTIFSDREISNRILVVHGYLKNSDYDFSWVCKNNLVPLPR